jgi:hypothetical protein
MKRFVTIAILMGAMFVTAISVTANSASAAPYIYGGGYTPYVSTYYPGYYAPRAAYRRAAYVPAYNYYATSGYVTTPTYYAPYPTTTYYQPYVNGYQAPMPYVYGGYSYGY